jgi:sulfate permease, SulP family
MNADVAKKPDTTAPLVSRVTPGLAFVLGYQRDWLRHDFVAGLSVAAVALPTAIAYALLERASVIHSLGEDAIFPTLEAAALACQSQKLPPIPDSNIPSRS